MGACSSWCGSSKSDDHQKFAKGSDKDLTQLGSGGPIKRGCTDSFCLFIFVLHFVGFFAVVFAGVADGDPRKLYRPRDYRGDFCGMKNEIGLGAVRDYNSHGKLTYMMNVTSTVEEVAKMLVCSSAAQTALQAVQTAGEFTQTQMEDYLCECCISPCDGCSGSLGLTDFSDSASLASSVSGRMSSLTSVSGGSSLFSTEASGAYTSGSDMFAEMTKYFNPVCYRSSCAVPGTDDNETDGFDSYGRTYTYSPTPDLGWKAAWDVLASNSNVPSAFRDTIANQFTFQALNTTICPYDAQFCVPFPGVNFTEMITGDYCMPEVTDEVIGVVGGGVASALDSSSLNSLSSSATASLGTVAGDVWSTVDTLIMVSFFSFIIGLIFMVLLRYLIGCFIWSALVLIFVFLVFGGGVAYARSGQCAGASLLDSGTTSVVAVTVTATSAASSAISGDVSASEDMVEEGGWDYRGRQTRTRSGKLCQRWDTQGAPHDFTWTPENYPNSGLVDNYCRNPTNATTIWCMTTDATMRWEICSPLGVLQPACPEGYEIPDASMRDVLKVFAYIIWALALIWLILVLFMKSRIDLAIGLNKAAADFVMNSPSVLLVPVCQITVGLMWLMFWAFCASFILSQVPATYVPVEESYATYVEAAGNATVQGACNNKWPQGFAWRYDGDVASENDTCSGVFGDTTGMTPRCWRCAPPRYVFDAKFAYIFFTLLWNNAFLIAIGQCVIALAVGIWFFTPRERKGKHGVTWKAFKTVLRYHLGSLAFGAFIIAVVQFIRYLMKYFEKQAAAQKNRVMVYVLKALQCCIWCVEKCLKFLNKNAYIQIALMGTNFCVSAKAAFFMILRNFVRFGTMLLLGSVIYYIGLTFILVCTVMVGYFTLQAVHPGASPVMPVLLYMCIGYLAGKLYMNVFGLAVDASLQCFIAAEEMDCCEDFAPKQLVKLLPKGGDGDKEPDAGEQPASSSNEKSSRVQPGADES